MKKNVDDSSFMELKKLLLTMKLIFALMLTSFIAVSANSYSQATRLSVNMKMATVKEVFDAIEQQSEYIFFYQDQNIDLNREVSIEVEDKTIDKVLDKLFENTGNTYRINDRQVIIGFDESKVKSQQESPKPIKKETEQPQKRTVSGTVSDEDGIPLPGVSIIVKGTTVGSISDSNGSYALEIPIDAKVLVFSFIGMKKRELIIEDQEVISIRMEPEMADLDEVVVIGYGTVSRADLLGAVGSVKASEISEIPAPGIDGALTGRVAGVQVVSDGAPGSNSEIRIRGIGSLTAGGSPLIVVDGYPMNEGSDLNSINPQDIESIDVLKDAASTAIYGSRGANGVIMITTKSGKSGKPKITYSTYMGFQTVSNPIELLDAYQFTEFSNEKRDWDYVLADPDNRNWDDDEDTRLANGDTPRPEFWQPYLEGTPGLVNNDWFADVFRKGMINSHDISVSGRDERTSWYVSLGYLNQEGIIIETNYKRYSAKIKLETKVTNKIKYGINLSPSISNTKYAVEGWNNSPISMAMLMQPYYTPYNDKGELNISQQIRGRQRPGGGPASENPVATAKLRDDHEGKLRLFGNTFLELEIINGLKFKTLFGGDFDYYMRETFQPSTVGEYRVDVNDAFASASESTGESKTILSENTLNYIRLFNKHSINAIAGYSYQRNDYKKSKINAPKLDNDDIQNIGGTAITTSSKSISEWVLISYFGRLQYNYDSRYFFSGSIRRDGSSRFGDNTKFGVFPALSGGWSVSNEDFFPKGSVVNQLKFRYSWGKTGNNQIGNYGAIATLGELNGYVDDQLAPGLYFNSSPNADLSWETTITNNIGLDFGIFNSKLGFNVDLFRAKTQDMLLNVPVPQQSGFNTSLQNIGEVENKGIEVVLYTNDIDLGPIKWSGSFNFSKVESKVLRLAKDQEQIISGTGLIRVGDPIGQVYGYVADGIFKTQEEVDAALPGSDGLGQVKIVNTDGNEVIDANDRTVIGNALPDFTYGFNNTFSYKNIDLNIFIDGISGVDLFDKTAGRTIDGEAWGNKQVSYFNDRWHPENNPDGNSPRAGGNTSKGSQSTYALQDGSFLRIRNITLGYNLSNELIKKIGLENLRIYATAKDPFLFTKYKGFNPEQTTSNPLNLTNTEGRYPLSKSFVFGLNVTF